MAKEIPYFRFTVSEWLNGDINMEDYETKGLFIDICAYYWFKDCRLTKQMLSKRFANTKQMLDKLFESKIIKESANDLLEIKFLDEQYEKCSGISIKRSKSGKLGGLARVANAKQMLSKCQANAKQMPIYKDKDKDKERLETRSLNFKNSLEPYKQKYGDKMVNDFYRCWSEPNKSKTKMRFELQKTWDTARRLITWESMDNKFSNKQQAERVMPL